MTEKIMASPSKICDYIVISHETPNKPKIAFPIGTRVSINAHHS